MSLAILPFAQARGATLAESPRQNNPTVLLGKWLAPMTAYANSSELPDPRRFLNEWVDLVPVLEASEDREFLIKSDRWLAEKNGKLRRLEAGWNAARTLASQHIVQEAAQSLRSLSNGNGIGLEKQTLALHELGASLRRKRNSGIYNTPIIQEEIDAVSHREGQILRELAGRNAEEETEILKQHINDSLEGLMQSRPHLFFARVLKAAQSPSHAYRVLASYQFDALRRHPLAARLAQTYSKLQVHGDAHPYNVIIEDEGGVAKVQLGDLDDTSWTHSWVDLLRAKSALLIEAEGPDADKKVLLQRFDDGYSAAVGMDHEDWLGSVAEEKAVQRPRKKKNKLTNQSLVKSKEADPIKRIVGNRVGADLRDWNVYFLSNAGAGSIGGRRYNIVHPDGEKGWDIKELWLPPASVYFTGEQDQQSHGVRVWQGIKILQQVMSGTEQVLAYGGVDWVLRKRRVTEYKLGSDDLASQAFVLGGIVGQWHATQRPPKELRYAAAEVSEELVLWSADLMKRAHSAVNALLHNGAWTAAPSSPK